MLQFQVITNLEWDKNKFSIIKYFLRLPLEFPRTYLSFVEKSKFLFKSCMFSSCIFYLLEEKYVYNILALIHSKQETKNII